MTQLKRTNGKLIAESETLTVRGLCEKYKHDLRRADLAGANLEMANLKMADLEMAKLAGANLKMANLKMANLKMADLWGVNIAKSNLEMTKLQKANLEMANLEMANLWRVNLAESNLEKANLQKASLDKAVGIWAGKTPSNRIIYGVDHRDKIMWQVGCRWGETQEIIGAINADYADFPAKRDAYIAVIETGVKVLESQRESKAHLLLLP